MLHPRIGMILLVEWHVLPNCTMPAVYHQIVLPCLQIFGIPVGHLSRLGLTLLPLVLTRVLTR